MKSNTNSQLKNEKNNIQVIWEYADEQNNNAVTREEITSILEIMMQEYLCKCKGDRIHA